MKQMRRTLVWLGNEPDCLIVIPLNKNVLTSQSVQSVAVQSVSQLGLVLVPIEIHTADSVDSAP